MYLISAYFDDKSNHILQRYIDQIAEGAGNHFMTANHVPPHLTISAVESRSGEALVPILKETFNGAVQGTIKIVSAGALFPYVFYAAPILNQYLQQLSLNVYEALKNLEKEGFSEESKSPGAINKVTVNRYYLPMQWFPHITLGKKLSEGQMLTAFQLMQKKFAPFDADIQAIGLTRTNPHENIFSWHLKGGMKEFPYNYRADNYTGIC